MQNDSNAPAPWRFCRQQILAFVLLNLLGSCVHTSPSPQVSQTHDRQPQFSPVALPHSTKSSFTAANNS